MTTADQKQDIFHLAREGPYTPLKNLIDVNPKAELSKRDDDGRTVLHWACSFNKRTALAKQLLTEYAAHLDVNATDFMNWTPLHIAVSSGDAELSAELLSRGADVWAKNGQHALPVHYAASKNLVDCSQVLLDHVVRLAEEAEAEPQQQQRRRTTLIERLLLAIDGNRMTPVMRATTKAHLPWLRWYHQQITQLLGASEANGNQKWWDGQDKEGNTSMHLAVEQEYWDIVRWVFETVDSKVQQFFIDARNRHEQSIMDVASKNMKAFLEREILP